MEKRKSFRRFLIMLIVPAALALGFLFWVASAPAGETEKAPAIQFNLDHTLDDNLAALKGKTVTVNLSGGQSFTGKVAEAKNGLLHLEKLSGKEFYDALIVIEEISAVEARVR